MTKTEEIGITIPFDSEIRLYTLKRGFEPIFMVC